MASSATKSQQLSKRPLTVKPHSSSGPRLIASSITFSRIDSVAAFRTSARSLSTVSPQKKHIVFHINDGPVERSCRTLPHGSSCSLNFLYTLESVNFLRQLLCTKTILGPELRYSSRSGLFITGQKLKMVAMPLSVTTFSSSSISSLLMTHLVTPKLEAMAMIFKIIHL